MTEAYGINRPFLRIWCGCGCDSNLVFSKWILDKEEEYYVEFVDPEFYDLKYRLKLAFTPREKYNPFGIIILRHQYDAIRSAFKTEFGKIPKKEFQFELDEAGYHYHLAKIVSEEDGKVYDELCIDSDFTDLSPEGRAEVDVYPGPSSVYKPKHFFWFLDPTFRPQCMIAFGRKQVLEFFQLLQYYWETDV